MGLVWAGDDPEWREERGEIRAEGVQGDPANEGGGSDCATECNLRWRRELGEEGHDLGWPTGYLDDVIEISINYIYSISDADSARARPGPSDIYHITLLCHWHSPHCEHVVSS